MYHTEMYYSNGMLNQKCASDADAFTSLRDRLNMQFPSHLESVGLFIFCRQQLECDESRGGMIQDNEEMEFV